MQDTPKLGQLCDSSSRRDCVHVAICPVIAYEDLGTGHRIQVKDGYAFYGANPNAVVDPYLDEDVKMGDKFYALLFPGTVTSLRHLWSAPGFEVKLPDRVKELADAP